MIKIIFFKVDVKFGEHMYSNFCIPTPSYCARQFFFFLVPRRLRSESTAAASHSRFRAGATKPGLGPRRFRTAPF